MIIVVACIAGAPSAVAQSPQVQPVPSLQAPGPQGPMQPPAPPAAQPDPILPPQQGSAPAPGVSEPRKPDGFFDAWNRWMDKSSKDFKASIDESNAKWRELGEKTEKAAKDAAAAQKEAAEAFKNLSNTRVVEGRQICEPAPNGSVDCQAAAEVICRSKGFGKGQSADIQTTRKCSAKAFLSRDKDACRTETVVVKAACQ